ncbi:MAG TPA: hypothetical protein VLC95_00595 [Anaerolineae bacterium]|nr:hypothetical protein [Anaerolineae bacterium]
MSEQEPFAFNAAFWFQWIMATAVGWVLGSLILGGITTVAAGVGVGILQWPVAYQRIPRAWRWPVVSALGWGAGWLIAWLTLPTDADLLAGPILGATVGIAQWLLLRREVRWAGWWVPVSLVAWTTGISVLPGILVTGAMAGSITGFALDLLLNYPRPSRSPEPEAR